MVKAAAGTLEVKTPRAARGREAELEPTDGLSARVDIRITVSKRRAVNVRNVTTMMCGSMGSVRPRSSRALATSPVCANAYLPLAEEGAKSAEERWHCSANLSPRATRRSGRHQGICGSFLGFPSKSDPTRRSARRNPQCPRRDRRKPSVITATCCR
jgi:hypothetical protein